MECQDQWSKPKGDRRPLPEADVNSGDYLDSQVARQVGSVCSHDADILAPGRAQSSEPTVERKNAKGWKLADQAVGDRAAFPSLLRLPRSHAVISWGFKRLRPFGFNSVANGQFLLAVP